MGLLKNKEVRDDQKKTKHDTKTSSSLLDRKLEVVWKMCA